MPYYHRKSPAHPLPVERDNRPTVLFVTVCLRDNQPLLARERSQSALLSSWREAARWSVGFYLLMPDHVHLFCVPSGFVQEPVNDWCAYWKRQAGKHDTSLQAQFQRDCWDTQIRDAEHYYRKMEYTRNNPVRKQLVEKAEDWPYTGMVHAIPWLA